MKAARVLVLAVALIAGAAAALAVNSRGANKPEPAATLVIHLPAVVAPIATGDIDMRTVASTRTSQCQARPPATASGNSLPGENIEIHSQDDRKIDGRAAPFGVRSNA